MFDLFRSIGRPARRCRRHLALVPSCEVLETRTLLSGNVAASLNDGDLSLDGDQADNSVEVTIEGEDIVVRGLNGTSVNGSTDDFIVAAGVTTFGGSVHVALGRGADTFLVNGTLTIGGSVNSFDLNGEGKFAVTDATVEGSVRIASGNAADTLSLVNASIDGDLSIALGDGRNFVSLSDSTVLGGMDVWTGNRNDVVLLEGSTIGGLNVATGGGNDDVIFRETTIDGDFVAWTGRDRDFVMIEDSTVTGDTQLWLGLDSDLVAAQGTVHFGGDFFAGGILGRRDTIELSDDTTIDGHKCVLLFENQSISDLTGVNARIDRRLTEAQQFRALLNGVDLGELTLTVDTSSNPDTVQSNNTLVTTADTFTITGTTLPQATVDVAAGPNGALDLGSVTAGSDGTYSVTVDLLEGPTTIMVTATDILDRTVTQEFNLHVAAGPVVRFQSSAGTFDVELFKDDAPQTVANFLNYSGRYVDSIVHRSAVTPSGDPFVIQGGGFTLGASDALQMIATDPPVMSEASPVHSNVRGTIAMALSSDSSGVTDPDSGTSQWFINLRDNSTLDAQGFTVFGTVIGDGMDVVDAIAALDRVDINNVVPLATTALSEVPLKNYSLQQVQLAGTVSIAANSIQVEGTGTAFTTELNVNDVIEIEGESYRVLQITSDTQLLVDASHPTAVIDAPYFTEPIATTEPTRDQYVVFDSIGAIL